MPDEQMPTAGASAAPAPLYERSDSILARILGGDLMTATMRVVLIIVGDVIILATIAALAG
jgi:hypothetical protein